MICRQQVNILFRYYVLSCYYKWRVFILIFVSLVFINPEVIKGQGNISKIEELNITYKRVDIRRIERVNQLIDQSYNTLSECRTISNREEALKKLHESAEYLSSAVELSQVVYDSYISEFYSNVSSLYARELRRGKHHEQRARDYLRDAKMIRYKLADENDFITAYNLLSTIFEYETHAILSKARAVRIFQDFPVEYPYEWDDYVSPELLAAQEPVEIGEVEVVDEISEEVKEEYRDITFMVQIAAHTSPIPDKELRVIYPGNRDISVSKENEWYRYTIGYFKSFSDAYELLREINIEKAFVVAYDERGERIMIKEALQITGQSVDLPDGIENPEN